MHVMQPTTSPYLVDQCSNVSDNAKKCYLEQCKGGDTRTSASYESLVRVHDTRSHGETIESGELPE